MAKKSTQVYYYGTGRRKDAVARVRLVPGNGTVNVNAQAPQATGSVAVGYGKTVCIRMKSDMAGDSAGGIYVLIGSYGFLLRGGEFRTVQMTSDGTITETARNLVEIDLLGTVLDRIVKQSRADGIGIKPKSCGNLRNRDRMRDIRLSADPKLPSVELFGIFESRLDFIGIVLFARSAQNIQQTGNIGMYVYVTHCFRLSDRQKQTADQVLLCWVFSLRRIDDFSIFVLVV